MKAKLYLKDKESPHPETVPAKLNEVRVDKMEQFIEVNTNSTRIITVQKTSKIHFHYSCMGIRNYHNTNRNLNLVMKMLILHRTDYIK